MATLAPAGVISGGTSTGPGDTTADIRAAQDMTSDAAVQASQSKPAPASTLEADLAAVTDRVNALEPVVNTFAHLAPTFVPGAAAPVAMFDAVESVLNDFLGSLHLHFGGKIAGLPDRNPISAKLVDMGHDPLPTAAAEANSG